jgi:tetratricopeptide (TPR) repeat protein
MLFPLFLNASEMKDLSRDRRKMINLFRSGRLKEALIMGEQTLKKAAASNNENNPETVSIKWEMANINMLSGEYKKAENLLKECVDELEKLKNKDDKQLMSVLKNLMWVYETMGKTKPLNEVKKKMEKMVGQMLESESDFSAFDYITVAEVFTDLGMNKRAVLYYQKGLSGLKNDRNDKFTASLFHSNLGVLYMIKKDYAKAIEQFKLLAKVSEEPNGEKDAILASSFIDLGAAYLASGNHDEARNYFLKARKIYLQNYGEKHSSIVKVYDKLGRVELSQKNIDKAEKLFRHAIELNLKLNTFKSSGLTDRMLKISKIYQKQNQPEKSEKICKLLKQYFQTGVRQAEKNCGTQHPLYADSLNWLALLHVSLNEFEAAVPLFNSCLSIYKKVYSENHPKVAKIYQNLASAYFKLGKYKKSAELFSCSEKILKKIVGPDYPMRAVLLENYSQLLEAMGKVDEAVKMKLEAQRINSLNSQISEGKHESND